MKSKNSLKQFNQWWP